jgi:hypothetical protein
MTFSLAGINPSSPAVRAVQAQVPEAPAGRRPPGPGTSTHPSARRWRRCSRSCGACAGTASPGSPTLGPSVPANPAGYGEVTDFDGASVCSRARSPCSRRPSGGPWPRAARRYLTCATDGKPGSRRQRDGQLRRSSATAVAALRATAGGHAVQETQGRSRCVRRPGEQLPFECHRPEWRRPVSTPSQNS